MYLFRSNNKEMDISLSVFDPRAICEGNTADEATMIDYSKTGANKR